MHSAHLTRRRFLSLAATVAAASAVPRSAVAEILSGAAHGPHAAAQTAASLTTLAQTLGPGPAGRLGYRPVVTRPGESHVVRGDLAAPHEDRATTRIGLLSLVHLTDQHVLDAQSTSRVEFLDRYVDGDCKSMPVPFASAHRPHEAATARIADGMLRRLRRVGVSPVTGQPFAAAVCTGDNTDNAQANEVTAFLSVMNGGEVRPQSGDAGRYEGVQVSGDPSYWHPDPRVADRYKTRYGFPAHPQFLTQALAPFEAVGFPGPWYTCYGNHDGLAQGNEPFNPAFEAAGTGAVKVVGLPAGANPCTTFDGVGAVPSAPVVPVAADSERRYTSRREWIARHLASPGAPHGHGYTQANLASTNAYYSAEVGALRFVVLDTVNPGGGPDGSVGDAQLAWLDERLAEADAEHRLVLIFSHHGPRSLTNNRGVPPPMDPSGGDLPRHLAADVLAVVARHRCVIAWVNGHSHLNTVTPRGSYWDVGTAAHIDWPMQSRILDVVDNRDGTLSLFTTMVDHEGDGLVGFARELAGNDPQKGFAKGTGQREDRNTELLLPHPFPA